jgi:hypothetical protein
MTIKDGNPTQNITATVDPYAVAQIVREMQRQDAPPQQKESRFQTKIKNLLDKPDVDKDNLNELKDLVDAKAADLKDELGNAGAPDMVKFTQSRYNDTVTDALDKYIEGDEPLEKSAKLLEYNVSEKLKKDNEFMSSFNQGVVDKRKIATIAKETVEAFSKDVLGRDKSAKGPAITAGVPGTVATKAIENGPPAGSIDEIVEPHRREAYFKYNALLKRTRVTPEEAHNKALAMATKNYKKSA